MNNEPEATITPPTLQDVLDWQDSQQGQLEAIQTALCALLRRQADVDTGLAAHMQSALAGHRHLIAQAETKTPPPTLAGFDSMRDQLLAAFQAAPTAH